MYFAASISDRGDEFFDQFAERYSALLAEQEAGSVAFYVLVDDHGAVLGRFNLYDLKGGSAELGYPGRAACRRPLRGERCCPRWRQDLGCAVSLRLPSTRMPPSEGANQRRVSGPLDIKCMSCNLMT
jgi:hypothetical protein